MATFKDRHGREWRVELTLGNLPHLRAAGFDVGKVVKNPDALDCLDDPETLGRVLWKFCEGQAEARKLTPEEFADGFDGPTVHAAGDAIVEALADFSQRPGVAKAIKDRLPAARAKLETALIGAWEATLQTAPGLTTTTPTGSSDRGGNSPASPGSTPGP